MKKLIGVKNLGAMCLEKVSESEDVWKSIYDTMKENFIGKENCYSNNSSDIIVGYSNSFKHYFLEALYCIKYSFRRIEKIPFIISTDDEEIMRDRKGIEKELFKNQRNKDRTKRISSKDRTKKNMM